MKTFHAYDGDVVSNLKTNKIDGVYYGFQSLQMISLDLQYHSMGLCRIVCTLQNLRVV